MSFTCRVFYYAVQCTSAKDLCAHCGKTVNYRQSFKGKLLRQFYHSAIPVKYLEKRKNVLKEDHCTLLLPDKKIKKTSEVSEYEGLILLKVSFTFFFQKHFSHVTGRNFDIISGFLSTMHFKTNAFWVTGTPWSPSMQNCFRYYTCTVFTWPFNIQTCKWSSFFDFL